MSAEQRFFIDAKHDFKGAKKAKVEIDNLIIDWVEAYYGRIKNAKTKRSKFVMKEIAKHVEQIKPNLTEPFTSTSNPCRMTSRKLNANYMEKYINGHFTGEFNRTTFIEEIVDTGIKEGTAWIRSGWKFREAVSKVHKDGMTMEEILSYGTDPKSIKQRGDGKFDCVYETAVEDVNEADARVCKNENCFPDPDANNAGEMRFFAERVYKSLSDLKIGNRFSKEKLRKLQSKMHSKARSDDESSRGRERKDTNREYGKDDTFNTNDIVRQKVKIIEYWGFYDLDGDGIAEPVVGAWAEDYDLFLGVMENPYPSQKIPYNNWVYSPVSGSVWGNALAFFILDDQKLMTSMMRGIIDNMSLANNGQKFVHKSAMDYAQFRRMKAGERVILVNKMDMIGDGSFNQLPSSLFETMSLVKKSSEDMSGANSNSPANGSSQNNKEDNPTQLTQSQQRMSALVRSLGATLSNVFREWITMAEVFLSNDQIADLFSPDEQVDFYALKDSKFAQVNLKVGSEALRTQTINQLNMLMQQSNALGEQVPPHLLNNIVAEMFELFDQYDAAVELRNYRPEPTPQQQMAQALELQEAQLNIQKLSAEVQEIYSNIKVNEAESINKTADAQATIKYKDAQSYEKYAKAESHKVGSALKPAEVLMQARQNQNQNNNKGN